VATEIEFMKVIIEGDNIVVINALERNFKDRINRKIKKSVSSKLSTKCKILQSSEV